ncbi:nucleoside 2-deoxyribosyltransferase [Halobacillus trueperi]|uniref:nucleoside 2-deoxyribosyltransferase n=1 Tax=Halobacillus trueperi TaxID=156205 RepID=UPI00216264CC|nr:nucleoside 2-deoxyribosyltransferase [Halobacillus trueperi]
MKFYVASSFKNKDHVRYVSEQLRNQGYIHTYDWTVNERASSLKELREIGQKEKEAVMEADVLIVILPAGKGSHIEYGIALGLGKTIYLYSEDEQVNDFETTSTFYHLSGVEKCIGTFDELVASVIARGEESKNVY